MSPPSNEAAATSPGRLPHPSHRVPERVHVDAHMLLWQHRGTSDVWLDGHRRRVRADQVCLVPAGTRHALHLHAGSTMIPLFLRLGLRIEHLPGGTTVDVDDALRDLLLAVLQHESELLRTGEDVQALVADRLGGRPHDALVPPMPTSAEALVVAHALVEDAGSGRTLDELAALAFTSRRTLERQFREETGLSPRCWRTRLRLAHAAEQLRSGLPVPVAAARAGYQDVDAFCRAFKRRYGTTPRRYAFGRD